MDEHWCSESVRWLRDFLRRLASDGRTVLISSHVLGEVAQTVDSLLFGLVPSVGRFMPTRASDALMGLRVDHLVSPGVGAITMIAWAGALGVLGIALSVRQDIN